MIAAGRQAELLQAAQGAAERLGAGGEVRLGRHLLERIDVVPLAEDATRADRQLAQVVEPHAGSQQTRDRDAGAAAVIRVPRGEPSQPLLPEAGALEVGAEAVELFEGGIDARLHGELAQQAAGEPVDGADGRVVEGIQGGPHGLGGGASRPVPERPAARTPRGCAGAARRRPSP